MNTCNVVITFRTDINYFHLSDIAVSDGITVRTMPNRTLAEQFPIIKPSNIKKISGKISNVGVSTFTVTPADTSVTPSF
jgi:hypothetical protein